MERVRANRALLNQTQAGDAPENELAAFLDLFHPRMSTEKKHELLQAARTRKGRR
jgi:hypothetical protein